MGLNPGWFLLLTNDDSTPDDRLQEVIRRGRISHEDGLGRSQIPIGKTHCGRNPLGRMVCDETVIVFIPTRLHFEGYVHLSQANSVENIEQGLELMGAI